MVLCISVLMGVPSAALASSQGWPLTTLAQMLRASVCAPDRQNPSKNAKHQPYDLVSVVPEAINPTRYGINHLRFVTIGSPAASGKPANADSQIRGTPIIRDADFVAPSPSGRGLG